jgi:hypothetical protein
MKRILALFVVATTLLGIAIACGTSPVIVGTFECASSDASDNPHRCLANEFCAPSCGSTAGHCEKIDSDGCAKTGYECGCDGITYYNGCLREEARVTRAASGQCTSPVMKSCFSDNDCPGNGSCASVFDTSQLFEAGTNLGNFSFEGGFPDAGFLNGFDGSFPNPFDTSLEDECRFWEKMLEQNFPKACWALPAADASTHSLLRTACTGCNPDLTAIRMGGVLITCPSPDPSAD